MNAPHPREEELFSRLLALPSSERAAFLARESVGDAALRTRVEALLRAHEKARSFLEAPPATDLPATVSISPEEEGAGDVIGRYKLLQKIGEGGCGIVYMAEQEVPVRRRVALKVIKLGMDTKAVIARFEAERQALAMMDHPNIAKVLDAGATDNGRPFFVMELVRGVPITKYCDEHNLSTAARLSLFTQVCHAIQHAHQKGIIHRDIKPSNILVTLHDGVPVPKVIDFGIAKATLGRLTDQTVFTAFEQFIGTPAYMSPEQAEMSGLDIDTRSDIYSLGVLLYELLTGKPPFDPKTLLAGGLDEIRRIIREVEPPKPSTRLSTLTGADGTALAKLRGTDAVKLSLLIRGDLDWIVMRCLEKDRMRRYESASSLAADIVRHLQNEPVTARPPSTAYLLQKFVRRNRLTFAAAAAIAAALVVGFGVSTWAFVREKAARTAEAKQRLAAEANEKKARTEAVKSEQAFKFMAGMLHGVGPSVAAGRDTALLREILDKTVRRMDRELKDQPDVDVNLRSVLSQVYLDLGDSTKAETLAGEAMANAEKLHGRQNADFADALTGLALVRLLQGRCPESETLAQQALDILKSLPAAGATHRLNALYVLGGAQSKQERLPEADTSYRAALALARQEPDAESSGMEQIQLALGNVLQREGRLTEAEPLIRDAVAALKLRRGSDHPEVGQALMFLSTVLQMQNKLPEAAATLREALATLRKSYGPEHPFIVAQLVNEARLVEQEGKIPEAEALLRQALVVQKKVLGPQHDTVANTLLVLSQLLQRQGKSTEAETLQREAMAIKGKVVGEDLAAAGAKMGRVMAALQQDKWAEAEAGLREVLAITDKKVGRTNSESIQARLMLAQVVFQQHRYADAESVARELIAAAREAFGDKSARVGEPLSILGRTLHAQGKLAESEVCVQESLTIARAQGAEGPVTQCLFLLTALRLEQGDKAGAELMAREAVTVMRKLPEGVRSAGLNAADGFVADLRQLGKRTEAMAIQRQMLEFLRQLEGSESMAVAVALPRLVTQLNSEGKFAEAAPLAREGWELRKKLMRPNDWGTANAQSYLGQSLLGLKNYTEAEPVLLAAFADLQQNANTVTKATAGWKDRQRETMEALAQLYEETNQPAKAAEWKAKSSALAVSAAP